MNYICIRFRGISSVGRASGSQSEGQGFDPPMLHLYPSQNSLRGILSYCKLLILRFGNVLIIGVLYAEEKNTSVRDVSHSFLFQCGLIRFVA